MKIIHAAWIAGCLVVAPLAAVAAPPASQVKVLMNHPFADIPGKEGLVLEVTMPPGGADGIHRHDAHVFVYMLEGSAVMQVKGGQPVTLKPGQTFYESPSDIHLVGKNASSTKKARFLAVLVKDAGKPPVIPVN